MKEVIQKQTRFEVQNKSLILHEKLPVGVYNLNFDDDSRCFFLEKLLDFVLPDKIYGKSSGYARRVVHTFLDRPLSTGVLLSGIKGSGKSLLAKQISVLAKESNIPTIVINRNWKGDSFNAFIQSIESEAVIIFDEFEKTYQGHDDQNKILTLLDGVYPTKKLFLITSNETRNVSDYLINRPGRIYYSFEFKELEKEAIIEYCNDNLNNKSHIDDIIKYTTVYSFFNFDMLHAVVEEMNRYKESMFKVLEVLNIEPEMGQNDSYTVTLEMNDKEFLIENNCLDFEPKVFQFEVWLDSLPDDDEESRDIFNKISEDNSYMVFLSNMVREVNFNTNEFIYELKKASHTARLRVKRNRFVTQVNPLEMLL